MIKISLHGFVDRVMEKREISGDDVKALQGDIFADGIVSREEADVLIALDRAVAKADPTWADFLVRAVVDFAVWTARPTGYIDQDGARWLTQSLSCGAGPTETAARIAFEIVKEAHQVDEVLLAYAMRTGHGRSPGQAEGGKIDLAA
jgi:hypothetical protein